ncbi:hypothetical protein FNL56_13490 [Tardiphaga sp. vice304]|uniref:hypothetical protein n=1 Tax=Tardiphaga sp. vice304 TaxID=2592817 RepID=UPI0011622B28|nr:hypothetical protein [Tardiphaga sp. vice304]QDM27014.1 hypothetical protein FNL56_13490 [Tardiphaga sp. vice304]
MINTAFVVLTWLVGLAATFGPVAVILGLIFVPAVAVPLISSIAKRFLECVWCIVAVVALLMCVGSYWVGYWDAAADCRAGELEAKLRNARIDAEVAKKSADDEFQRAGQIEATAEARQKDDHDYITHLEARPSCNLDDNDLGRVPNNQSRTRRAKPATGSR